MEASYVKLYDATSSLHILTDATSLPKVLVNEMREGTELYGIAGRSKYVLIVLRKVASPIVITLLKDTRRIDYKFKKIVAPRIKNMSVLHLLKLLLELLLELKWTDKKRGCLREYPQFYFQVLLPANASLTELEQRFEIRVPKRRPFGLAQLSSFALE